MDDLLREFLSETSENIAILDVDIVRLEKNPHDVALISTIFRIVHNIKGTSSFLNLPRLERLAHASENILSMFRDGELPITPYAISLLLNTLDHIKSNLCYLESHGAESKDQDNEFIAQAPQESSDGSALRIAPLIKENHPNKQSLSTGTIKEPLFYPRADQSIRIDVRLLDHLMTTMNELVQTRNQLLNEMHHQKDSSLILPLQRLHKLTTVLQDIVLKTRLQPIGKAWAQLPRIVRDLSKELEKKIDLQLYGAETELDRQVIEHIKAPLTHMVRNSADHGIELPAERIAKGKSETGTIILKAYQENNLIIIEISDDGRGLDVLKIKSKLLENNRVTMDDLAMMPDTQIIQYIFEPGFTTASTITAVSGRGVGMDVVKNNIEKVGGQIDYKSTEGKGSHFLIRIPAPVSLTSTIKNDLSCHDL